MERPEGVSPRDFNPIAVLTRNIRDAIAVTPLTYMRPEKRVLLMVMTRAKKQKVRARKGIVRLAFEISV